MGPISAGPEHGAAAGYAAVVLAGGAGRRLGGRAKPTLPVGGRALLHRVLSAATDADPRIVVGPADLPLPTGVLRTREQPPGGGPVAATAAGLELVPARTGCVALLAADLPFLTTAAVRAAHRAVLGDPAAVGAVYVDEQDRPQWLCGVWRTATLRERLAALPAGPAGASLRGLLGDAPIARLRHPGAVDAPPPYWDCDTEDELRRAEDLMSTMEEWSEAACRALGLDPAGADAATRDRVLDLARDAAHHVVRPAAPVSTYLLGLAVGRGADPARAAAALSQLARDWQAAPQSDPQSAPPAAPQAPGEPPD